MFSGKDHASSVLLVDGPGMKDQSPREIVYLYVDMELIALLVLCPVLSVLGKNFIKLISCTVQ